MSFANLHIFPSENSARKVSLRHGDGGVHVHFSCQIGGDGRGEGAACAVGVSGVHAEATVAVCKLAIFEEIVYLLASLEVTALNEDMLAAQTADG